MPGSWLKETFEKGVDELQKIARTGSIKIDIANLKKKRDERVKVIGNKVLTMIKRGELKADIFEPDYSYILDMDVKIEKKEAELLDKEPSAANYEPQTQETVKQEPAKQPEPVAETPVTSSAPVVKEINDDEDEEHDPHEDYINRPG